MHLVIKCVTTGGYVIEQGIYSNEISNIVFVGQCFDLILSYLLLLLC